MIQQPPSATRTGALLPSTTLFRVPVTLAFALTARARVLGPPPCDIREAALAAREHLQGALGPVAIVLGTERSGLTNEDIELCQRVCHIPANPESSSLHVYQDLKLAARDMLYALASAATLHLHPTQKSH